MRHSTPAGGAPQMGPTFPGVDQQKSAFVHDNGTHGNLIREVFEETGLQLTVGAPCLVNEFHDPKGDFHQVDIYFRGTVSDPTLNLDWRDPEGIVTHRRWVSRADMAQLRVKPDSLAAVAWADADAPGYDPLEPIVT